MTLGKAQYCFLDRVLGALYPIYTLQECRLWEMVRARLMRIVLI